MAVEAHWGLGVPEQPPREPAFGRRTDQWRSMPTGGWGCPNNPHTSRHSAKGPTSGGRAPLGAGGARTTPKRAGIPLTAGFGCLEEPGTKKLPLPRFVLGCPHMGTFGMLGYLPLIPVFGCLEAPGTKKIPLPRFVLGRPHVGPFGIPGYLPLTAVFGCL